MALKSLDCAFCYNKTEIEYEVDEDGELKDPTFCPFCGIKEDELDNIYDQHYPILEELEHLDE